MERGVGSKNKEEHGLRHDWNSRHDSVFFNCRGSLPLIAASHYWSLVHSGLLWRLPPHGG